jgi:D-tyrosyl-tRNA(Tyr) deacylase
MRCVVQRVAEASVEVNGAIVSSIGNGILALVSFTHGDGGEDLEYVAQKILGLRIFDDERGIMNLSLSEAGGGLMIVSQFTLHGDARKGRRPSYSGAMPPQEAAQQYNEFLALCKTRHPLVQSGVFGALMGVRLLNDGPVTILLDSRRLF